MRILFLLFFASYLLHAVVTNRHQPGRTPQHLSLTVLMMQAPLFLLACYFGAQYGVFSRDLVSPFYIGMGLLGGHLVFGVSLLITHRDLHDAAGHFLDLGSLWRFFVETPGLLLRFAAVSITEEMIYRVAAQTLLIAWTRPARAVHHRDSGRLFPWFTGTSSATPRCNRRSSWVLPSCSGRYTT